MHRSRLGGKRNADSLEDGEVDSQAKRHKTSSTTTAAPDRPKLMSTIASVTSPSGTDPFSRWDPNAAETVHAAKPAVRDVDAQPDNMRRNRRMLGAIMGHLDTARKNLEKDQTLKLQETVVTSAMQKNKEEGVRIAKEGREKVTSWLHTSSCVLTFKNIFG